MAGLGLLVHIYILLKQPMLLMPRIISKGKDDFEVINQCTGADTGFQ